MKNNWTTEQKKEIGKLLDEMFILVMDAPRLKGDEPFNAKEQFKKDKGLLPKLEVGKWYKGSDEDPKLLSCVISVKGNKYYYYGFNVRGEWKNNDYYDYVDDVVLLKATYEEVLEALTKEAEKRGLKEGVNVKSLVEGHKGVLCGSPVYDNEDGELWCILEQYNILLFCDGIWATIVDEPNQELEALKKK